MIQTYISANTINQYDGYKDYINYKFFKTIK